tara:strand:+ start:219 stop:458 length:240 start_codon:yes stop_codon:yes gene_type:complete
MKRKKVNIKWPNNKLTVCYFGEDWLQAASDAKVNIPTGCLSGSCGACEIETNGKVIRACIETIPNEDLIEVEFFSDPFW